MNTQPGYGSSFLFLLVFSLLCWVGSAPAQDLILQADLSVPGQPLQSLQFGLRQGALAGVDPFDVPAPPASPANEFTAYLSMLAPPEGLPNAWLCDFRSLAGFRELWLELWEMNWDNLPAAGMVHLDLHAIAQPDFLVVVRLVGPDGFWAEVPVPGTVGIPITAQQMTLHWEVVLDVQVPVDTRTWGGLKSLYR